MAVVRDKRYSHQHSDHRAHRPYQHGCAVLRDDSHSCKRQVGENEERCHDKRYDGHGARGADNYWRKEVYSVALHRSPRNDVRDEIADRATNMPAEWTKHDHLLPFLR